MCRVKIKEKTVNPVKNTNFFSRLFFAYTAKLFLKGYRKELTEDDIYEVLPPYESKKLGDKLEKEWSQQTKKNKNSVPQLLFKCFGKQFFLILLTLVFPLALTAVRPRLMKKFILYFASDRNIFSKTEACGYGTLLILAEILSILYKHNLELQIIAFTFKIRAGFTSLIYRKVLQMESTRLDQVSIGKIITLITKDVSEFEESLLLVTSLFSDILKILVTWYVLYAEIGWFSMILVVMVIITLTFSTILAIVVRKLKAKTLSQTDKRLQMTKEVLSAITLVKCYLWGDYYEEKLQNIRKKEVCFISKIYILLETNITIASSITDVSWYVIVIGLIFSGIQSNAGTLFLILNSLTTLRFSLQYLPWALHEIAVLVAVSTRIGTFLRRTEQSATIQDNEDKFSTNIPLLNFKRAHSVCFEYSAGITAITGPVGSGKSFFLKVLAKENQSIEESEDDTKSFSYACQEPWLFPSTIKRNILFGSDYDHEQYFEVLRVCALLDDLQDLKEGDSMVVADRGVNLSRGQQARINLARAVYKDRDVYLLDDCLSHLDVLVADFIFEECFRKFLKDKIVVIVTQNLRELVKSDRVVTLENSAIKFDIRPMDKAREDEQLLEKTISDEETSMEDNTTETTTLIERVVTDNNIYQEVKVQGKVKPEVYKNYVQAFGGLSRVLFIFLLVVIIQVLKTSIIKMETNWINSEQIILKNSTSLPGYTKALENRQRMLYILPILILVETILLLFNAIVYWFFAGKASVTVYKLLMSKVLNASAEFFNHHFSGNILNRLSEDMFYLDEYVPRINFNFLKFIADTVGIVILVSTVNIYFLIGCLTFGIITFLMRIIYLRTGRAIKRLEFSTRSPLVGHINATLEGLATIRILKTQNIQREEFDNHQNLYTSSSYMYITCEKAFHFAIDTCAVFVTTFAIVLFLVLDEEISSGSVGLGLLQILRFTAMQNILYRIWSRVENYMTTVERIQQYTKQKQENKENFVVENWPREGEIRYEHVYLSYNSTNCVLNDLSFVVKAKTKVAIIGRTACGKTSLTSTLLRLYEIKGSIYIDNVDIATLPLDLLRSNVSIISQEPSLFSGTVRENIDPTMKFGDDEIWDALKTVHLSTLFQSLEDTINSQDTNLSTGQKQLLCLCRALVRNNKILVLDEVTASVDSEAESIIHNIILNKFIDSTVIIITHKLKYILDYDKVLVLDKGIVVEFDHPHHLLDHKSGLFYNMYNKQNE